MNYLLLPRILPVVILLAMPLALELAGNEYWAKVMVILAIMGIMAMSWDLLRMAGMFSLGQGLFFGLGSYVAASLNHYLEWPIILTIPIGTIAGAILGTVLLLGTLKLRGIYFAMVTLAFPLLLVRAIQATNFMGGTEGVKAAAFPDYWTIAYLAIAALLVCFFGLRRLMNSDWGLVARAIGQDDIAVTASGIDVTWRKIQVLFIASGIAAFAGTLMTHFLMYAGLSNFSLEYSILPVASVVIGGSGNFAGALLGSSLLTLATEALRALGALRIAIYSLLMVFFALMVREGIFPYLERRYHQFERKVKVD
ncbi:MAG: branched-chain amino acid ABC transporter permease [Chloroflexi bacterium]|nr:branched-chain amino acid ABC transporter permease [Chloroflexota bacterium]MBM3154195.1 branched-chain amino acid ABC transporter permease [Chloroflexota bacterium]MBM3172840.1 branched-chain amino acid ABC transporter permease [Chloroflexota bacterium]MBM3174546.1 branched-chain amino acid ABC transporter permease [Chloroflexota bacterium]MBM4449423.1 branched-chain amino acid ABC transporter permease [Chloroflexota bacterium]